MSTFWSTWITRFLLLMGLLAFVRGAIAGPYQPQEMIDDQLDLSGKWGFREDPLNIGVNQEWWKQSFENQLTLPGSMQHQGFGEKPHLNSQWTTGIGKWLLTDYAKKPEYEPFITADGDAFKSPFWLTPKRHYVGQAWYQREFTVDDSWRDKFLTLHLERPHWQTTVWIDQQQIGSQDSLGVPHRYDLGNLEPGSHTLTILVDNRLHIPVGVDAHSVTDQTQTNWNGIIGTLHIEAHGPSFLEDIQIYPELVDNSIKIVTTMANPSEEVCRGTLTFEVEGIQETRPSQTLEIHQLQAGSPYKLTLKLPPTTQHWDEFNPTLYGLHTRWQGTCGTTSFAHQKAESFGMRKIGRLGTQFTINGRSIFLRGTLESGVFPETGYPPMDIESWRGIFQKGKQYGLNHFRFHSWTPPRAAFKAADLEGIYLQVEAGTWAVLGEGSPVDPWLIRESQELLRYYGNHPSFVLMASGNEQHHHTKQRDRYLSNLLKSWPQEKRQLYAAGSGWPQISEDDFHVYQPPRLHDQKTLSNKPTTDWDYSDVLVGLEKPIISHEIGQWTAFPYLAEIPEYQGFLQPSNLEVFNHILESKGLGDLRQSLTLASGKLQAALYKEEIEAARRTPGFGGFQLLDLRDYPGQGTAPVGVLTTRWKEKGYINATEYRNFNGPIALLTRIKKRLFHDGEELIAEVDLSHFGEQDLKTAMLRWRLEQNPRNIIEEGMIPLGDLKASTLHKGVALIRTSLATQEASMLTLRLHLEGTRISNHWNLWVYPQLKEDMMDSSTVKVVSSLTEAKKFLKKGLKVLLIPRLKNITGDTMGSFQPIFWNRVTFKDQKQHTLGILANPTEQVFAHFPTQYHADWQWWSLLEHSKPMDLSALRVSPLIRVVDDWLLSRHLGLLFEAQVGEGSLMVSSMNLAQPSQLDQAQKQMRHSILRYMEGQQFKPQIKLTLEQLSSLVK